MGERDLLNTLGDKAIKDDGVITPGTDKDAARKAAAAGLSGDAEYIGSIISSFREGAKLESDAIKAVLTIDAKDGQLDGEVKTGNVQDQIEFQAAQNTRSRFTDQMIPKLLEGLDAVNEQRRNQGRQLENPMMGMNGFDASGFPVGMAPQPGYTWVRGPRGEPMQVPNDIANEIASGRDEIERRAKDQNDVNVYQTRLTSLSDQMKAINDQIVKETDDKKRNDLIAQGKVLGQEYQKVSKDMQKIMRGEAAADKMDHKFELDNGEDWREYYQKWSQEEQKYRRKVHDDVREWLQKEQSKDKDAERRMDAVWQRAQVNNWSQEQQFGRREEGKDKQWIRQQAAKEMDAERKYLTIPSYQGAGNYVRGFWNWLSGASWGNASKEKQFQASGSRSGRNTNYNPMGTVSGK